MEYASKNIANAGLTTGIIGTALGALGSGGLNGILGGRTPVNSEDEAVTRYEMHMHEKIAEKDELIAKLESERYCDDKIEKLSDRVNARFGMVENQLAQQATYNATVNGSVSLLSQQVAQLQSLTKIVVPNANVMPGWGDVTITPASSTTTSSS